MLRRRLPPVVIGIDVAAARLNCVALDERGSFAGGRIYAAIELSARSEWAAGAVLMSEVIDKRIRGRAVAICVGEARR